jgi:cytidine deaminase
LIKIVVQPRLELGQNIHHIPFEIFDDVEALAPDEHALLATALLACDGAYAPFSHFQVGCAVLLADGSVMTGNNQENPAFPSSLCAERTVLYYAGAHGHSAQVRKIAVRARSLDKHIGSPVTPCGACRQVMLETERQSGGDLVVLMQGVDGKVLRVVGVAKSLLPFGFDIAF